MTKHWTGSFHLSSPAPCVTEAQPPDQWCWHLTQNDGGSRNSIRVPSSSPLSPSSLQHREGQEFARTHARPSSACASLTTGTEIFAAVRWAEAHTPASLLGCLLSAPPLPLKSWMKSVKVQQFSKKHLASPVFCNPALLSIILTGGGGSCSLLFLLCSVPGF